MNKENRWCGRAINGPPPRGQRARGHVAPGATGVTGATEALRPVRDDSSRGIDWNHRRRFVGWKSSRSGALLQLGFKLNPLKFGDRLGRRRWRFRRCFFCCCCCQISAVFVVFIVFPTIKYDSSLRPWRLSVPPSFPLFLFLFFPLSLSLFPYPLGQVHFRVIKAH